MTKKLKSYHRQKYKYFPRESLLFRKSARHSIKNFFSEIAKLYKMYEQIIIVEFKIVFKVHEIYYMLSSDESKFVYQCFMNFFKKTKRKIKLIKIKPQLRRRLSGKALKNF